MKVEHYEPTNERKFSLGRIGVTQGVLNATHPVEVRYALSRHERGDWGSVEDNNEANALALIEGLRLLSVYLTASGEPFWVITEADRATTTVLMPEEY